MKSIGSYPNTRLRRNRKKEWSRRLVQENTLSSNDLIWPIFICEGRNVNEPIKTMPGIYRHSIDKLEKKYSEILLNSIRNFWSDENQKKLRLQSGTINATYSWDARSVEWKNFFNEARNSKR